MLIHVIHAAAIEQLVEVVRGCSQQGLPTVVTAAIGEGLGTKPAAAAATGTAAALVLNDGALVCFCPLSSPIINSSVL